MTNLGLSVDHLASGWVSALLAASWEGMIAAGIVWGICRLETRFCLRISPGIRAGLWWLVCARVLIRLFWWTPLAVPVLPAARIPASASFAPIATVLRGAAVPGVASGNGMNSAIPHSPVEAQSRGPSGMRVSGTAQQRIVIGSFLPVTWPAIWMLLWLVGAATVAYRGVRQLFMARRLARDGWPLETRSGATAAESLARRLGMRTVPEVRVSREAREPLVVGFLRPVIVLPAAFPESCTPAELELVLAHELAHLRRGDLWLSLVPALTQAVFFFHPLVWLATREWISCREAACDQLVLRVTSSEAGVYARLLLNLAVPGAPLGALLVPGSSADFRTLKWRLAMLKRFALVDSRPPGSPV